jgi:hypothetical protein
MEVISCLPKNNLSILRAKSHPDFAFRMPSLNGVDEQRPVGQDMVARIVGNTENIG